MSNSFFTKPTEAPINEAMKSGLDDNPGTRGSSVDTLDIHYKFLFPNPDQPRKYFPPEAISKKRKQLKRSGQESPITVLPGIKKEDGYLHYQIVDGECRWRAVSQGDCIDFLRAEIYKGDPNDVYKILLSQLVHNNDGSEQLTPVERAAAYKKLIDRNIELGIDKPQERVAEDIGMDKGEFSRIVSLNDMPEFIESFALEFGIGDTRVLNGLTRISKLTDELGLKNVVSDIKENEALRAEGGEARKIREIVQDAIRVNKIKPKEGKRKNKTKVKAKAQKTRLLSAREINLQVKDDESGLLTIETVSEIIKFNLTSSQVMGIKLKSAT